MFQKSLLKLFTAIAVLALAFSQFSVAKAAKIDFGGEEEDHFWEFSVLTFCKNGFTITATELLHDDGTMGDSLPFSVQLGTSDIPLLESLPAPIAGGDGGDPNRTLASGTTTFLFATQQPVGAQVHITIERWDHGLFTYHETPDDNSDHSIDFDDLWPNNLEIMGQPLPELKVGDCMVNVDTTTPVTIATRTPAANNNGWNNTNVDVQLSATDNIGGSGVKMIEYQVTGTQSIGRTFYFGNAVSIPISTEGISTISYFAWDNAANAEFQHTMTINIDRTAPGIIITSPQAQDYSHAAIIPVTWTASDALSGVASSSGTLDGSPITNGQSLDLFLLNLGPHTLTINAIDNADNSMQASVTFNVVVTIDSLIDGTKRACAMGWISKKGICASLQAKLAATKAALARGRSQAARGSLHAFLNELRAQKGKSVNQFAYNLLTADARYLLSTIP